LPDRLLKNLIKWGLVDGQRAESGKPLSVHLQDWKKALEATGTKKNAELKYSRVKRVFEACKFLTSNDISASKLQLCIQRLGKVINCKTKGLSHQFETDNPISQRTQHHILTTCKQFCKWARADGRTGNNPLEYLNPIRVVETQTRSAFSIEELRWLFTCTEAAETSFGLEGYQRAILYRFAAETGFRSSEVRALKVKDFDFNHNTITLDGQFTKNDKEASLPIKPATAQRLKELFSDKLPLAQAFKMPAKSGIARMLHKDLEQSRQIWIEQTGDSDSDFLAIYNQQGKRDFHSLRHTFATLLAATGTHPKTAQALLRHSKIDLTLSLYTHSLRDKETSAINNLPDMNLLPESQEQKKTGTNDSKANAISDFSFHRSFTKNMTKTCNSLQLDAKRCSNIDNFKNFDIEPKKTILGQEIGCNNKAAMGFEPMNNGFANRRLRPLGYAARL